MGVKLCKEPKLENPDMIACWPGIGNIGLIAVDTLRSQLGAEELGEIEPWDFFYPKKAIIRHGVLQDLEFPTSKFYYKRLVKKDLIFFIGEEQPADGGRIYAGGPKAYEMTNLVLDVAERFGCSTVYTSGAAVSLTHHTLKPRVLAVASNEELVRKVRSYENTVLMSEVEGRGDEGGITGLNGLLLGVAKKKGFDAICFMGEMPDYLSGTPFPYPRASKSLLEVFAKILGVEINYGGLNEMEAQVEDFIGGIYQKLPSEIRERLEQRKIAVQTKRETITEEDKKWLKEHIDEFFQKGSKDNERGS